MRSRFKLVIAWIFTALIPTLSTAGDSAEHLFAQPRLDHINLLVKDLDATARFFTEIVGWRRNPLLYADGDEPKTFGSGIASWIDANGIWLELTQPTVNGADMERTRHEDVFDTIGFEADDFRSTFDALKTRGITLKGFGPDPLENEGRLYLWVISNGAAVSRGEDYAALVPPETSRKIVVEIFQRGPTESSIIRRREALQSEETGSPDGPRLNRVVVRSEDPGKAAKFFTDVLYLNPDVAMSAPTNATVTATSDGHQKVWVGIEALGSSGAANDGHIKELAAQVDDIAAFYDRMAAKGIRMVTDTGAPLPAGKKFVVSKSGEWFAYFPLNASRGIPLRIYQHAPR